MRVNNLAAGGSIGEPINQVPDTHLPLLSQPSHAPFSYSHAPELGAAWGRLRCGDEGAGAVEGLPGSWLGVLVEVSALVVALVC